MSRISKWKLEKTKVKVVFRLQFHATHIPQTGWDKLFISFIPADSGKATAKTTKSNVRNGTCKWADPIYETTRLLQDIKTKQYDEKLYKLVVAMGSSRSSILGEADINLADYADALKPSDVALSLNGCDSGATLHVTVQLLTSKTGFREFEQQREQRERGLETTSDQNSHYESAGRKVSSSAETVNDQMDKINARVRFKKEPKDLPSLEEEVGLNEEYADSAVGFDGSSNTSESLYAEKHEVSSIHEIDSLKSTISGDLGGLSLSQSPQPGKGDPSDNRFLAQGTSDWVHGWSSDYSADNDLAIAYEENSRLRASLEAAESSILELKLEVSSLQSHADEIGVEAQNFSQQLAAEIASGEELAKEVSFLHSECSKFKDDLEKLKNSKLNPPYTSRESIETDQGHLIQEIQLRWLKGVLLVEDKIAELQTKACFGFQEEDLRFLHSDLEALLGILRDLKQGNVQTISGLNLTSVKEIKEMNLHRSELVVPRTGFDADLYEPEGLLHCLKIPSLVSHESDSVDMNVLKGKLFEVLRELNESKAERESLARKMDQMECYYEALVQELEETQRQMMGELQSLRNEHSTCIYTISSTKAEMDTMHHDMNEKLIRLAEDKHDLESHNKELERRAITAEAALKRARLNYSIAVNQLQKDLELLSFQVLSMFETNENLVRQAFADSPEPIFQGSPEMVQNQKLGSEEFVSAKLLHCQHNHTAVKKQNVGGDALLEDLKRSLCLQEGLYQKFEEEACEMHLVNVYLDVFSKSLQESLVEVSSEFRLMKEKMEELAQQLELSTESKELLMFRLQAAMDDVHSLNDYKATCIAKCNDLALHNQILESTLQNVTHENHLLNQRIAEWEALMTEYRSYKKKYEACTAEKLVLENLLNKKTQENGNLQNDISVFQEELKEVRFEFNELTSEKENQQNTINFLQEKLWNLLASYDKKCGGMSLWSESFCQDLESKDLTGVVLQLEEFHHNALKRILQLMEENKGLLNERDLVQVSLRTAESDNLIMKQKFEHDIRAAVDKLDVSNSLLQKFQLEIEATANRLKVSSEADERYAQQHRVLLSDLDHMEAELQKLASKNKDLAQEILALETVTDDLGRCKLSIAALQEEKDTLIVSLQDKNEESAKLALELCNLKGSWQSLHDELHIERSSRDKLESTVFELNSQLDEKQCQLIHFDQQKAELVRLKQMVSDLELEKRRVGHLLLKTEECLKNVREECSSLENQLSEMHEFLIDIAVRDIFTKTQYEAWIEDLLQQLAELHKKHLNDEAVHDRCLASEAHYNEENARLLTSLDSLKSELEASIAENRVLLDKISVIIYELEEYKNRAENVEATLKGEKGRHALEVESLEQKLVNSEEKVDNLMFAKEELEVKYKEENARLLTSLDSLKSELEASTAENRVLLDKISVITYELEEYKNRAENVEATLKGEKGRRALEVESLEQKLVNSEEKVDNLMFAKEELEVKYKEENARLLTSLDSLKSELEASTAENRVLFDKISVITYELEEYKNRAENVEATFKGEKGRHALEVESLEQKLVNSEEKVDNLMFAKEELEVIYKEENARLLTSLDSLKSELEASTAENRVLLDKISVITYELEEYKNRAENVEATLKGEKGRRALEVESLEQKLVNSEEKVDNLMFAKEELEVKYKEENARLLTSLDSLKSELEASTAENRVLFDKISVITYELEEYKNRAENVEATFKGEKGLLALEVDSLEQMLVNSEEKVDNLMFAKEELEVKYKEENARLLTSLDSLKSELEASTAENRVLFDKISVITYELEEYKNRAENVEATFKGEKGRHALEVESLEQKLVNSEEKVDNLMFAKEELEVIYKEENARLLTSLDSLKSELEASTAENRVLLDKISVITYELEEYKIRAENVEATLKGEKGWHALEVERLEHKLVDSEEKVDNLMFSKEELEVKSILLKAKVDEQHAHITLLEGYNDELIMLRKKCSELSQRLAEQVLRTEEFKNLSIHLKELKDKADAVREKREPEGPPVGMQESLRIAFIKEQYETKLQELKHHLSISKKHSDEMLWKLQDAINEVENKKKSESSHLKRNEELGLRILELEAELQSALSEKRELMNACDLMKAEKECSFISLECCKEEKQELEAFLQKCNDEKSKIAEELTLMKDLLESSASHINVQKEGSGGLLNVDCTPDEPVGKLHQKNPILGIPSNGRISIDVAPRNSPTEEPFCKLSDKDNSMDCEEAEYACTIPANETDLMNVHPMQDILLSGGGNCIQSHALVNQEDLLHPDTNHLALTNDHFKAQNLKNSMDHLNKELERMKHENTILPQDDNDFFSKFPGLQRELMQLRKANEELGSIYPLYNEFSSSGNALERVLALEIELAEALQEKKKSSIHFQSSFLRQHSDEEAIFHSFRAINELIKDMLELKERYTGVETELKEMHDRYSQLSLQFAEVEGERQKLMMTLKSVRASKKTLLFNRSSSASLGDDPS
nr:rootletin isoform X4 [Quercus suber]